jgi:hypothetical protein
VRAFTAGMAPLTIGLLLATGWVLTEPARHMPAAIALVALTVAVMLRTKASPLWLIAAGAVVGGLGWVVLGVGQNVHHAHDIGEGRAGLGKCRADIAQALFGLRCHVVDDGHGRVVEAGGARNKDPVTVDDGARVTDLGFEGGAGADETT